MLLLINLPPTDSAPLPDYVPYLNLLRELLRQHADQIPPHPIAISVKPGDLVLLKGLLPFPLGLQWTSPHLIILTTPTAVKLNGNPQWQHLSRNRKTEKGGGGLLESSREQHFTVVLLANAHRNAYVSCSPTLKLPPLYHNQLYLQGYQSLQNCPETAMRAPTRTQESEDLTPYNHPLPAGSS
jgi:hypothetical protein